MAYLVLIFSKITEIQAYLAPLLAQGKTIGFVPTMGALHEGHLSLIRTAANRCDYTVCSIFVNPTQFNDKSDLARYPRMPEKDAELLKTVQCDVLFLPQVEEVYPSNERVSFNFGSLDQILEAKHRPGHFNGVAQVVKRFFEIIQPTFAFFGSKDYQQVMIVKALVKNIHSPVQIISCPILREPDGLAMSSRNALLTSEERKTAALIPKVMQHAKQIAFNQGIKSAGEFVKAEVAKQPLMKLDYYEICEADSLKTIQTKELQQTSAISLIALHVGKIRLIDNWMLND
jgi:pantoate--beta-alanine ligase